MVGCLFVCLFVCLFQGWDGGSSTFFGSGEIRHSLGIGVFTWERAKRLAPSEANRQYGECSRTFSANQIGFFTRPK